MSPHLPLSMLVDAALRLLKITAVIIFIRVVWYFLNMFVLMPRTDPLRLLPGPRGGFLQNHFRQVMDPAMSVKTHREWKQRYGKTFRFHGFGKHDYRLMSFDYRVVTHILGSSKYEKPWQTRAFMGRLVGRGIFVQEGAEHRKQRRIIHPAFTTLSIKNITPIMVRKAEEVCARWHNDDQPTGMVDVARWMSRASFDILGLGGFDYDFHSLGEESEPVYCAYRRMFNIADKGLDLKGLLILYFPILRTLWADKDIHTTNESLKIIDKAGKEIVAKKRIAVEKSLDDPSMEIEDKDILSLLIKSNLCNDESRRLSDQELVDQLSTFLLAGSDTVSVALAWCYHHLAQNPTVQDKLRREINEALKHLEDGNLSDTSDDSGFHDTTPRSFVDVIDKLDYLEAVIRETLRFAPPVHATIRVAAEDDLIPVSHPMTFADGTTTDRGGHIKIRKGSYIHIPIEGLSYSTEIWGEDAEEFKPDRWKDLKESIPTKPGAANLMTFGQGPHSCLGQKFSLMQMKIFLAVMLPRYAFAPVEGIKILKGNSILTRPYVAGDWERGTQLPVTITQLK